MEEYKSTQPQFSQACDRLYARIIDLLMPNGVVNPNLQGDEPPQSHSVIDQSSNQGKLRWKDQQQDDTSFVTTVNNNDVAPFGSVREGPPQHEHDSLFMETDRPIDMVTDTNVEAPVLEMEAVSNRETRNLPARRLKQRKDITQDIQTITTKEGGNTVVNNQVINQMTTIIKIDDGHKALNSGHHPVIAVGSRVNDF